MFTTPVKGIYEFEGEGILAAGTIKQDRGYP
jgi:hypothetical protein